MSLIETIGDATLYLGDCREILPMLGKVNAVVTDPPYGINYKPYGKWEPIYGDNTKFEPGPWLSFKSIILWGANHYTDKLPCGGWLVWDKRSHERGSAHKPRTSGNLDKMFGTSLEMAWCNFDVGKIEIMRLLHGGLINADSDVANNAQREHPTQKPVQLMKWCIGRLPELNQIILDPFMGSGTTGVAAVQMSRRFVGIEIDQRYFDTACRRIEAATKQADMFANTMTI